MARPYFSIHINLIILPIIHQSAMTKENARNVSFSPNLSGENISLFHKTLVDQNGIKAHSSFSIRTSVAIEEKMVRYFMLKNGCSILEVLSRHSPLRLESKCFALKYIHSSRRTRTGVSLIKFIHNIFMSSRFGLFVVFVK